MEQAKYYSAAGPSSDEPWLFSLPCRAVDEFLPALLGLKVGPSVFWALFRSTIDFSRIGISLLCLSKAVKKSDLYP
jgi:hypothetical protein